VGGGRERDSRIKTKLLYVVRRPRVRASIYIHTYKYLSSREQQQQRRGAHASAAAD